jgi:FkbM family methyltransferase
VQTILRNYRRRQQDPVRRIRALLGGRQEVYVVQIGSNDGKTGDPIHSLLATHSSWRALFVEPVPFVFERLRQNYPDRSRFAFENVAISDRTGTRPFYYVDQAAAQAIPDLPEWYDQLGSFDRDHVRRHFGDTLDRFIVAVDVKTATLAEVLARHVVKGFDLLHVDTEGADWAILSQLDLPRYRPRVILVEHKHLPESAKVEMRAFLREYRVRDLGDDYIFWRR